MTRTRPAMQTREVFQVPFLLIQAAIACISLFAPRRATALLNGIVTSIAIGRVNMRWLAVTAGAQNELYREFQFENGPAETHRVMYVDQSLTH